MKKLLLLLILVFVVFVAYNRQRLFLRDPLGSVLRDGVKEAGAMVFINYSNDVLIENDRAPLYVMVVQHGDHVGTPAGLRCFHYVACLADADVATLSAPAAGVTVQSMSNKAVELHHGKQITVVALR